MSVRKIPAKIPQEAAQEWIKSLMDHWREEGFPEDTDGDLLSIISPFYPKKTKSSSRSSSRVSSSSSERSSMTYDPVRCDARVWLKGGFAGQCTCKKHEDGALCKRHQGEADKNSGMVKNGFFNSDRPDYHYGDSENGGFIPWNDSTIEPPPSKSKKTRSSSGPRKCSLCGCVGHNKRKCPTLTQCQPCESAPAAEPATEPAAETAAESATETAAESATETAAETAAEPEPAAETAAEPEVEPATETAADPEPEPETAADPEPEPETAPDPIDTDTDLQSDDGAGVGLPESDKFTSFTHEGVSYIHNSDGDIFDPNDEDEDSLGKWISDDEVEFNRIGKKAHKFNKAMTDA